MSTTPPSSKPSNRDTSPAPASTSSPRSHCRADHPILSCDQVVLTPHLADQTPEGIELLNEGAVTNVIAFLEGRPNNVVT